MTNKERKLSLVDQIKSSSTYHSKSYLQSKEGLSSGGNVDFNLQTIAKEAREDRRGLIGKIHKYLFTNVSHFLCVSNEEVEEFALDDPLHMKLISRFLLHDELIILFHYQKCKELTFEECGRSYALIAKDRMAMRILVTKGDTDPVEGKCVFFLKRGPVVLEEKNIVEEVISGCLLSNWDCSVLQAIANYVGNIFQPTLLSLKNWGSLKSSISDSDKCTYREIFVGLENFIQHLSWAEQHVKNAVKLEILDTEKMLHIDGVANAADFLNAAQNRVTVEVMEEIATRWCQQVEMTLTEAERIRREADDTGPKKELEFWLGMNASFSYLVQQLRNKRAKSVFHVLHIKTAPVMKWWRQLDMKITDQANEARDNVKYLYTLEKYCEPLYRCQPIMMLDKFAGLISTIRLIYNFSHYYNSSDKVSSIFVKITNQIVTSCKNYISDNGFSRLWDIPKDDLYVRLNNCMKLFQSYINIFEVTKKKIANTKAERPFDFSEMYIFGKIFTFRDRIEKIICVLEHCTIFAPLETCTIEGIDNLANRFSSLFNNLKKKGYDLLNYRNMAFDEDFDKFLELADDLKLQIQKFMSQTLLNLKHSLDRLDMMKRFEKLKLDFLDIEKGYADILAIYNYELESMHIIYDRDKEDPPIPWNLPPISGRIYWVRQMVNHIYEPIALLQNCRPSVMKTPEAKKVVYRYNKFAYVLVKNEILYHIAWFRSVDAANSCLQVPILTADPVTKEQLINFDPYVFEVIKEAQYMVKLGLQVPRNVIQLIHSCANVVNIFRHVQMMLLDYTMLKTSIPDVFLTLMQPHIFRIDALIFPALTSITWTSLEVHNYFRELDKAFHEFSLLIKTVCDIKYMRIDAKLAQIAETLLCSLPSTNPWTMEEFLHNTKENTVRIGDDLNKLNKMICDTAYELLRVFINSAVNEYKLLEIIYIEEQRIGDPENKKTLQTTHTVTAISTLIESGEPDRSPLPEDLMTQESYMASCLALFEDFKGKMIDALVKSVRASLAAMRKRFLAA